MMKNVAIATDSHSSITPEMTQTLGVAVLPMPFTIDGTCYLEEETLTRAEFYAHQRRGAKIATSQPAPADVTALWDNLLTDHDEVVYIPISSGLSGSCQAAMALAADTPYAGRPQAMITCYDEGDNEIYTVKFYDGFMMVDNELYRITGKVYKELAELCDKYGECQIN